MTHVWLRLLGIIAGLFGAAGVGLAALGAHQSSNPVVTTAAYFLLFHAAALVALCAVGAARGVLTAASLLAAGTFLFSGDLALRGLADLTPVRLAAPTGGILMIVGWLVVAGALPVALGSRQPPPGPAPR